MKCGIGKEIFLLVTRFLMETKIKQSLNNLALVLKFFHKK